LIADPRHAGGAVPAGSKRILVLQHADCEPPGAYLPVLEAVADVVTVRLAVDPLPSHFDWYAIVAMGGPMGVNDRTSLSWLDAEITFISAALAKGVPFWGVCLGAQLLAAALNATIYTAARPEVGVGAVALTQHGQGDPVFGGLPTSFEALHWHSDTFELPAGAVLLATSPRYAHQVFRWNVSYGVQCHLEASAELAGDWLALDAYRTSLELALGPDGESVVSTALAIAEGVMTDHATLLMTRWLDLLRGETSVLPTSPEHVTSVTEET